MSVREDSHVHRIQKPNLLSSAAAVLTLIQHWVSVGRPTWTGRMGSFEAFAEVVGGILESCGVSNFLGNRAHLVAKVDAETSEIAAFVDRWWNEHRNEAMKASELHALATRAELLGFALGDGNERSQKIRMGKRLGLWEGRIFGERRIRRGNNKNNVGTYWLEEVTDKRGR